MATGCAPDELLSGGRDYFDALVTTVNEERANGWDVIEMLALLVEINHAQLRALIALGGSSDIPRQLRVPRPGQSAAAAQKRAHWQDIARMVGQH